jgi:hypothetical protein
VKFMTWPIHGPDSVVRPAVDAPAKERTGQGREGFDELKDAMYGMVNTPLVRLPSPAAGRPDSSGLRARTRSSGRIPADVQGDPPVLNAGKTVQLPRLARVSTW